MDASKTTSMASASPPRSSSISARSGAVADPGVASTVAQRVADPVEQGLVGLVALHVARGQLGHGGGTAIGVVPQRDRGAVLERAPQVGVHELDPVATVAQPELVDHQRVQQADRVGARAHDPARIGKGLLERAGAARVGCAARGRARCGLPGRDRRPRSARCGRRRPRRRPSVAPPAPRPAREGRLVRTPQRVRTTRHACRSKCALRGVGARGVRSLTTPRPRPGSWTARVTGHRRRRGRRGRRSCGQVTEDIDGVVGDGVLGDGLDRRSQPEDLAQGQVRLPRPQQRRPTRPARSRRPATATMARSRSRWSAVVVAGAADEIGVGEQPLGLQGPDLPGRRPRRPGQLVDRRAAELGRPRGVGRGRTSVEPWLIVT